MIKPDSRWRIGFIHRNEEDRVNPNCPEFFLCKTEVWARHVGNKDGDILRSAKELSEEVDVLILGKGMEETQELVKESIRIPVICVSNIPHMIEEIYGSMKVPEIDPLPISLLIAQLMAKIQQLSREGGRFDGVPT